jgi:hypothetical protein
MRRVGRLSQFGHSNVLLDVSRDNPEAGSRAYFGTIPGKLLE